MKKLKALLMAGFLVIALGACANESNGNDNNEGNSNETPAESETPRETAGTITITDRTGEIEVPVNPDHVVVFDIGTLDALDVLGVNIVGIPDLDLPDYLAHYADYQNSGGLKDIDLEAVYELQPDLIFVSGRQEEFYDDLVEIAPVVFVLSDDTNYMASFEKNMEILGRIFEKQDEVEAVIEDIKGRIEVVNEQVTALGANALVTMTNEENISAFGEQSRFGIIHNTLGFTEADENIEMSGRHGQQISIEYILETNPDFLFVVDRQGAIGTDATAGTIFDNDLMAETTAAKNDQIVFLDSTVWYLISGGITSTQRMIAEVEAGISQ